MWKVTLCVWREKDAKRETDCCCWWWGTKWKVKEEEKASVKSVFLSLFSFVELHFAFHFTSKSFSRFEGYSLTHMKSFYSIPVDSNPSLSLPLSLHCESVSQWERMHTRQSKQSKQNEGEQSLNFKLQTSRKQTSLEQTWSNNLFR